MCVCTLYLLCINLILCVCVRVAQLVYCIQHHHGEEKLRTYAEGLLRQETSLDVSGKVISSASAARG